MCLPIGRDFTLFMRDALPFRLCCTYFLHTHAARVG
jgi:hypothetical protein